MEMNVYCEKSMEYEKSLDSAYKKELGIFYTNTKLAKKIIEFLNVPLEATIVDPCCGTGSFIISAENLGYKNIFGADIDSCAVRLCKETSKLKNIYVFDTLGNSGTDVLKKVKSLQRVDYVVGNPPYVPISKDIQVDTLDYLFLRDVKDSGSNLFVAALYRAFELAKPTGTISYIIPKNFLHVASYSLLRKKILKEKCIHSIIDIGACFKSVRGEQIILTLRNSYEENNKLMICKYEDEKFVEKLKVKQDFYKDEIMLFDNKDDYSIYQKLESSYKKFSDICTGYVGRGKSRQESAITGKDIRKFGFKSISVPKRGNQVFIQNIYSAEAGIIASFAGELEATQTVTVFTDGDEKMCRYMVGFLHSRLCNYYLIKFCYNSSKLTMHTDAKYLKKLPLIIDKKTFSKIISIVKGLEAIEYMCDEWFEMVEDLNKLIYQTYNIQKEESEYIDLQMRCIQSKRWNNDK